jgi:parallel beta-helix repeat protein
VLFLNSDGSIIEDCTITNGVRDLDGAATDAAVVAKFSRLTVRNCRIVNNDHRPDSVVVGIGGIMGREGSELYIHDNYIFNNGWDGIALYRGAVAVITDNHIEKGRGAGIGITWDAVATVLRNRVSGYWKGIGSFGTSRATVRNNIVKDCLGWGIIATGTSFMEATNNLIFRNGNCGFANWSEKTAWDGARGICANNIIMLNGWREQWVCPCVGVWMMGKLSNVPVSYNNVFANQAGNYKDMEDWTGKYGNLSVDPQFADTISFRLSPDSPLIDAGHPEFTDPDGSPSDIGPWGGPSAKRE